MGQGRAEGAHRRASMAPAGLQRLLSASTHAEITYDIDAAATADCAAVAAAAAAAAAPCSFFCVVCCS